MVLLLSALAFCIDRSFSNLAPYTVESTECGWVRALPGSAKPRTAPARYLGHFQSRVIAGINNIISPQATSGA